jgi:Flp pilus assembly pilin Flp
LPTSSAAQLNFVQPAMRILGGLMQNVNKRAMMLVALKEFGHCESGVNAIEYCLIGCTLSLTILPAVYALSGALNTKINEVAGYFDIFHWS